MRRGYAAAAALAVLVVAGGVAAARVRTSDPAGAPPEPATRTAAVTRRTLTRERTLDGTLGYGPTSQVVGRLPGTVTAVPAAGTVVRRGGTLYEVDGAPVTLLYGARPAYRTLTPGTSGRDVRDLERNLRTLGHDPGTVDDDYTAATAAAVRAWQRARGVPATGTVELGRVVFQPDATRVARVLLAPGAPAQPGQPVLDVTGPTHLVTLDLAAADQQRVTKGTRVDVELPDGSTTRGTVTRVGTVATVPAGDNDGGTSGGDPTVPVEIRLADERRARALDAAPVDVVLTTERRRDVLAVPVTALLALAEGGYAVETTGGALLPVEPGLHAGGFVEVTGDGLREGLPVVVPA